MPQHARLAAFLPPTGRGTNINQDVDSIDDCAVSLRRWLKFPRAPALDGLTSLDPEVLSVLTVGAAPLRSASLLVHHECFMQGQRKQQTTAGVLGLGGHLKVDK
uniref:Uncharacterized protein n=1 Tax=Oryza rufipogon TaxID=4529 RepID=A0A0E0PH92_ORYRU